MTRHELTDALCAEVAKSMRNTMGTPIQRYECKGTDGKWYTLNTPWGVKLTDERRPYWVLQARNGTTHGQRHDTEQEIREHVDRCVKRNTDEFRAECDKMTDAQLESQGAYWLKLKASITSPVIA